MAEVPRFNAIQGAQESAERRLADQRVDYATAALGTNLSPTSDLAIVHKLSDWRTKNRALDFGSPPP